MRRSWAGIATAVLTVGVVVALIHGGSTTTPDVASRSSDRFDASFVPDDAQFVAVARLGAPAEEARRVLARTAAWNFVDPQYVDDAALVGALFRVAADDPLALPRVQPWIGDEAGIALLADGSRVAWADVRSGEAAAARDWVRELRDRARTRHVDAYAVVRGGRVFVVPAKGSLPAKPAPGARVTSSWSGWQGLTGAGASDHDVLAVGTAEASATVRTVDAGLRFRARRAPHGCIDERPGVDRVAAIADAPENAGIAAAGDGRTGGRLGAMLSAALDAGLGLERPVVGLPPTLRPATGETTDAMQAVIRAITATTPDGDLLWVRGVGSDDPVVGDAPAAGGALRLGDQGSFIDAQQLAHPPKHQLVAAWLDPVQVARNLAPQILGERKGRIAGELFNDVDGVLAWLTEEQTGSRCTQAVDGLIAIPER